MRNVDYVKAKDEKYSLDMPNIKEMLYHEAGFLGDTHYVDVFRTDGSGKRIFNPDCVAWSLGE